MSRRKAREAALQLLFEHEMTGIAVEQALANWQQQPVKSDEEAIYLKETAYTKYLLDGTLTNLVEIDEVLGGTAKEWSVERMAIVDRNILRMALYELKHCPEVPVSVVINEAVELAKTFSTEEAAKFINGILGTITRK